MRYVFGDYILDSQRYQLHRGDETIALAPKAFDILTYLVQHDDRVVSKQELFDRFWPNQFVTDDALGRCIRAARQGLGDAVGTARYIATVRGRGYRFVAAVQTLSQSGQPQDTRDAVVDAGERVVSPSDHLVSDDDVEGGMIALEGEYQHVTALCGSWADVLGLAEQVGVERMHRLMQRIFAVVQRAVRRSGGTLIEFSGDRFLALFGAPMVQEDHGARAIFAALAIRDELRHIDDRERPQADRAREHEHEHERPGLSFNMGLHSGRVVVGWLEAAPQRFYTAVGEATQVAHRLSQPTLSDDMAITMSAAVHAMLPENVRAEPSGMASSPSRIVYRVCGVQPTNPVRVVGRTQSPFVGRVREMSMLHEHLALALDGQGQIVGLAGEPGMGKSRLLAEFRGRLASEDLWWCEGYCLSDGAATPYGPVIALLRQMIDATPGEAPTAVSVKAQQFLQAVDMPSHEALPLLLQLLDTANGMVDLSPQLLQERMFAILRQLVLQVAQRQPLVIVIKNLHWIDPTSEAWLASLVAWLPQTSLCLLVTYRSGGQPSWFTPSVATQMTLTRLLPADSRVVIQSIFSTAHVADELVQAMIARANGNPLFLEALAWDRVEQASQARCTAIPETIEAVMTARINRRLPAEKRLLQMTSAIGSPIGSSLLAAVSELSADALSTHLNTLQAAEFLLEIQAFPEPVYVFKHGLMQDVAYQSLATRTRQHYHQRIAEILNTRFPERVRHEPERLAYHFTQAGCYAAAVPYWQQAGLRAQAQAAHREAISHFKHGLDVLMYLPESPLHGQQALELRLTVAPSLVAAEGGATVEVGQFYRYTHQLCEQFGRARQLGRVLMGLHTFHLVRAELQEALQIAQRMLQLGEYTQDARLLRDGHCALGQTLMYVGEFDMARTHLERALDIGATLPADIDMPLAPSGLHPRMSALFGLSTVLWCLGYPDQALRCSDEAQGLADERAHPFNFVSACGYRGAMHRLRGEWEAARTCFETAVTLSTKYGLMPHIHRVSHQGAILAMAWHDPNMVEQMRRDLEVYQTMGMAICLPVYLLDLAAAQQKAGDIDAGLATLSEAFRHIAQTREGWCEAACYRLRGELLMAQPAHLRHLPDAEADLRQALAIAQRQGAKSWALRAAVSLCRLWLQQGRKAEARVLVTSSYQAFTEGFDTTDLRAAKQLLDEM